MTRDSLRTTDPAFAAALDRLQPPPISADFTDRVLSSARRRGRPAATRHAFGRRWVRGRGLAIGVMALALTSAAAAGMGMFEPIGIRVPAITRLVEKVTGTAPTEHSRHPQRLAKARPVAKTSAPLAVQARSAAQARAVPDVRSERIAQALASRIDRRIARRERLGLPVPEAALDMRWRPSPAMRERNPEKARLIERVQQIRASRRREFAQQPLETPEAGNAPSQQMRALRQQAMEQRALRAPSQDQQSSPAANERPATDWSGPNPRPSLNRLRSMDPESRRQFIRRLTPEQRQELKALRGTRRVGNWRRRGEGIRRRFR